MVMLFGGFILDIIVATESEWALFGISLLCEGKEAHNL